MGLATADITPDWPVPLAGFAFRSGCSTTVAEPLRLAVFAFASSRAPGKVVALCRADLLWWGPDLVQRLREQTRRRYGSAVELLLHASHTHSGPQTSGCFVPQLGPLDDRYLDLLAERVDSTVDAALGAMQPVTVRRSHGSCDIATGRRGAAVGSTRTADWPTPDPAAEVDHDVTALEFRRPDGRRVAVLLHYACHPVVSGTQQVSGDFTAAAVRRIEETLGDGAVVGYLQGAAGDVNPDLIERGEFLQGGADEVAAYGARFADAALAALAAPSQALDTGGVGLRRMAVELPLGAPPTPRELERAAGEAGVTGEWARLLLAHPARLASQVTLHLVRLDLGPHLAFLGIDAEPVTAYGRLVKQLSGGDVLPLGYTDGMLGYLVTADQLAQGGYEPEGSTRYFGLPATFAAQVQPRVEDALTRLVRYCPGPGGATGSVES